MNVIKKINDEKLTIYIEGRLDSSNVGELEKELAEIDNVKSIVFDFEKLDYISSAGLRIILKIKKQNDLTKVINCSSEVYEIFNMTGFTEIMDIYKALRNVSIEGCEIVGSGFYGTVYRLDEETIVKVYKRGSSIESIEKEIGLAKKAFVLGIPTAIPYDIVKVGDLYGAVFELINSKSIQEMIAEGADIEKITKDLVDLLKKIHSTKADIKEMANPKKLAIERATFCKKYLPKEIGEKLINLIYDIPMVDTMIHGDFHIKNIMKQNDEMLLIDMETISVGHPVFEFSAIYATYHGFACINKNNPQEFLGITPEQSEKILDLTFKYYFEGKSQKFIEDVMHKVSILSYMYVLWLRATFMEENNETFKKEIEFCIDYLTKNVPKMDSLAF